MASNAKRALRGHDPVEARDSLIRRLDQLYTQAMQSVVMTNILETSRQWLAPGFDDESETGEFIATTAMLFAAEAEVFKPSFSGKTLLDRFTRGRTLDADDIAALALFKSAGLAFLRIMAVADHAIFNAKNLVTGETIRIFDDVLPAEAVGFTIACRLYRLDVDLFGTVCTVVALDEAATAVAMEFVRPGRMITNAHRCTVAVFRHILRNGSDTIPGYGLIGEQTFARADPYEPTAMDYIVAEWCRLPDSESPSAESVEDARNCSSPDTIMEVLAKAVAARNLGELAAKVIAVYRRLAELQMETLQRRALAGSGEETVDLDDLATRIARATESEGYPRDAVSLFAEIRRGLIARAKPRAKQDELTRVIQRIRGLRAKTVDQGCSEDEAMAAAAKVAELLDRYGLSLSETDMRQQTCAGFGIESLRKRTGPLDDCLPAIARFCDCKAWIETAVSGTIRSILFGLPADVEAARYLYDRVAAAFDVETKTFQGGPLYQDTKTGTRRSATTSFQLGLARGIVTKLNSMKNQRDADSRLATGRDMVLLKTSAVDEELLKLGLAFKSGALNRARKVQRDAYKVGEIVGQTFVAQNVMT